MSVNLTQEEFINKVIKTHGIDKYSFEKTNYINCRTNIIVTCKKHNFDFEVNPLVLIGNNKKKTDKRENRVGSCPICIKEYFDEIKKQTFIKFKNIHNNEYEYCEDEYVNFKIPFHAICKKHNHKFLILGGSHIEGKHKCPICSGKEPNYILKIERESFIDDKRYYKCDIHGNVLIGKERSLSQGCPTCNIEKSKNLSTLISNKSILKKYGNKYNIIFNDDTTIKFICKEHNEEIIVTREKYSKIRDNDNKNICPTCININSNNYKREVSKNKIINIINTEYNHIYNFIDFIEEKNVFKTKLFSKLLDKEIIVDSKSILNKGISKNINNILLNENRGFKSFDEAKKQIYDLEIKSFREYKRWYKFNNPTDLPANPQRVYKEWISYNDFFGNDTYNNMSMGEREISKILTNNNINYIYQKRFKDCKKILCLPFDFYLPDYNLIVEYDGEQHFRPVFGEESFNKTILTDNIKNNYCFNNNIHIMRFTKLNFKRNDIEHLILEKIKEIVSYQNLNSVNIT